MQVPAPDGSGAVDDHGVHAFVVPLRDSSKKLCPGVEIKDCGYKVRIYHDMEMLKLFTFMNALLNYVVKFKVGNLGLFDL